MIKILDIEETKLVGINSKFANRRYVLTTGYRKQKELFALLYKKIPIIEGKFKVLVEIKTYKDVDALAKPVLDSMEVAGIIANDRNCLDLHIKKEVGIRGRLESLKVYIEEIK